MGETEKGVRGEDMGDGGGRGGHSRGGGCVADGRKEEDIILKT